MERRETRDRGTSPGQPGTTKPFQGGGGGVADAMMSNPEPGLPLLPGTSCADPTKTDFHRSQTLSYTHGYAMARRPTVGIGGDRLQVNQLSQADLDELANKAPLLTYGEPKQAAPPEFIPAHVAFDKKPALSCGCLSGQQAQALQDQGQEKALPGDVKQH